MKAAAHFIRIASGAVIPAVLAIGLGGYVHAAKGADISPAAQTLQDGALSADVRALLAPLAAKRVEGTFEERRSVPGFPKPMLSRGHFTLEGESLVWQTQTPFASLMKVTPEGVFLEAAGEKQALTAAEIPAVGRICTLLTSVMGGRFDALSDLFAVSAAQSEGLSSHFSQSQITRTRPGGQAHPSRSRQLFGKTHHDGTSGRRNRRALFQCDR